ncbi:MAG: RimK family alpha-L-glutamate ligase [Desulfobacterales bacterium]|jgi:ribosomal protein S6--L-glutamate ligase|nr:RimK family alpha-L-glutamate ligase [Desulfobacterales bacterium]
MSVTRKVIALERRLRNCRNVQTLGVRPNLEDYSEGERALMHAAGTVYYPSAFYASLFHTLGKRTFPSWNTYACAQDKIRQSALFSLLGIPHPRTRVFYGPVQKARIREHFRFPFVGKIPRGSALGRGVYLITTPGELHDYCAKTRIAYIQEYLPADRDMRVVVIGGRVVHAYWRICAAGEFRSNLAAGGRVDLAPVPAAARTLAARTAEACGWDDVGVDICRCGEGYGVLEANMKYGLEGFRRAGIDHTQLMETMIANGEI